MNKIANNKPGRSGIPPGAVPPQTQPPRRVGAFWGHAQCPWQQSQARGAVGSSARPGARGQGGGLPPAPHPPWWSFRALERCSSPRRGLAEPPKSLAWPGLAPRCWQTPGLVGDGTPPTTVSQRCRGGSWARMGTYRLGCPNDWGWVSPFHRWGKSRPWRGDAGGHWPGLTPPCQPAPEMGT